MPIVQLSWKRIIDRLDDETAIYFLTRRQASLLHGLAEQLHWKKTFSSDEPTDEEMDLIDSEVADLEYWLNMPVSTTQLFEYIDEIEDLLRALQTIGVTGTGCCDNLAPLTETHTTDNDPNEGDVPETYGSNEPIEDRDDWLDLICGSANRYVDLLKGTSDELQGLVVAGAVVVGSIAGILSLLSGAGILLAVGYGVAAGLTTTFIEAVTLGTFDGVKDGLEDARSDIVCAILNGTFNDLSDAIEEAVGSIAWTVWFQWIDYESAWSTMVDGGNASGDLEPIRGQDCTCVETFDINISEDFQDSNPDLFIWGVGLGGWMADPNELSNDVIWGDAGINYTSLNSYLGISLAPGDSITFHRIKFRGMRRGTAGTDYRIVHDGGVAVLVNNSAWTIGQWYTNEFNLDPPLTYTYPGGTQPRIFEQNINSGHTLPFIDDFEMDANINEA